MLLIYSLIVLFATFDCTLSLSNAVNNCTTIDCQLLNNIITSQLDSEADPCKDPFTFTCKNDKFGFSQKANMDTNPIILFKSDALKDSIINYLNGTGDNLKDELKSIKIESQLFQQCMKLDNASFTQKVKDFVDEHVLSSKSDKKWQMIDENISKLGLGNIFFNIKVMRNPLDSHKNMITLEPPKAVSTIWRLLVAQLKSPEILADSKLASTLAVYAELFLGSLNYNFFGGLEDTQHIIRDMIELNKKINYTDFDTSNYSHAIVNIGEWDEIYNTRYVFHEKAKINWKKVMADTFGQVDIDVQYNDLIFIKNKRYFMELGKFLSVVNEADLVDVMLIFFKIKYFAFNNLPSINSDDDMQINPSDLQLVVKSKLLNKREYYCILETPLYGVTYKLFNIWSQSSNATLRRQEILNRIVETMKEEINKLDQLSISDKLYYTAKINDVTANLVEYHLNETFVSNYYGNYGLSDNYVENIVNYHKIILLKDLRMLRDAADDSMKYLPLSINNLENLRDQLFKIMFHSEILNDELLIYQFNVLWKEYQYGTFGANAASFIYKAINEIQLDNDGAYQFYHFLPVSVITKPNKVLDCLKDNHDTYYKEKIKNDVLTHFFQNVMLELIEMYEKSFGRFFVIDDIVKSFGASIAHRAMQNDTYNNLKETDHNKLLNELSLTSSQLYFLTYAKMECYRFLSIMGIPEVLLKSDVYTQEFKCVKKTVECIKYLFDNKSYYYKQ